MREMDNEQKKSHSLLVRVVAVLAGLVLGIFAVLLLIPLPEVGVPLALFSLRLLGFQFRWARRANRWLDKKYATFVERYGAKKLLVVSIILYILIAFLLLWWLGS